MADLSDVVNVLVGQIAAILYPNGTALPSSTGLPTTCYPGSPDRVELDADLAAMANGNGYIHVTVFPTPSERVSDKFNADWHDLTLNEPVITLTISGQTVSIAGTGQPFPQTVSVFVNHVPYPYSVQPNDTPTSIATALAALIGAAVPGTTNTGPVLTLPAGAVLGPCRVGGSGTAMQEIGRQERVINITIWADTPQNRDVTAKVLDPALRQLVRILMPEGVKANMHYAGSRQDDMLQKANLYRRDLLFSVDYTTTNVIETYQITQVQTDTSPAVGGPVITLYD